MTEFVALQYRGPSGPENEAVVPIPAGARVDLGDSNSAWSLLDRRPRVSTDRIVRRHEARPTVGTVLARGLSLLQVKRSSRRWRRTRCCSSSIPTLTSTRRRASAARG